MKKYNATIIAHRGESFDAPENTLASVNLAWQRGADAVEVDIRLTKDNKVVVIHDSNTKRITGKNRKVKNRTLEELKKLDFGSWKGNKWKGEKIPTLKEILKTVPDKKKIIIEIKSGSTILPFLKNEIENSGLQTEQVEFISFNYSTIVKIKKLFPENLSLYLADLDYTIVTKLVSPPVEKLIEKVKKGNLDGLNVWAGKLLDKKFAGKVKEANLLLYTWTVNNPQHAAMLIDWKIDAITTDRAEWLKKEIKKILD